VLVSKLMSSSRGLTVCVFCFLWFLTLTTISKAFGKNDLASPSDTIFRQAKNSPGYIVAKKSDWDRLKAIWTDSLSAQQKIIEEERKLMKTKIDSVQQRSTNEEPAEVLEQSTDNQAESSNNMVLIFVPILLLLFIYGAAVTFRLLNHTTNQKSQAEQLVHLESDLLQHKKASIERERRLMRELIDTRNQLQALKDSQSAASQ